MEVAHYLPAEWHRQGAVQLTWPHAKTDWSTNLNEVFECFTVIAKSILRFEKLIIVAEDRSLVPAAIGDHKNTILVQAASNDSWARDHGGITLVNEDGKGQIFDFKFNGWGLKYPADRDNLLSRKLFAAGVFADNVEYVNKLNFVLEGGSIESNGKGCLLTTSQCLLSQNRNEQWNKIEIEELLKAQLGVQKVLWLDHGFIAGDDTDSHIDTLARFSAEKQIMYVQCTDTEDEHFEALKQMEEQLRQFRNFNNEAFELIPLPMPEPIVYEGERLPATYANFLIINEAVLVPIYGVPQDDEALAVFENTFKDRMVIPINCVPLIKQHGSLHCVTMQYPNEVIK